jgi:hypothetical protein
MDLSEIGGASEVDQLLSFGWLPHKAFHLGREDSIDLIFLYKSDQAPEIRSLFLRVFRRTDVVLFKDHDDLNPQATLLSVAFNFFKTFDNLRLIQLAA